MSELSDLEKQITECIIKQDCDAIFSLLKTERDYVFVMKIVPYYALFVQSCQEYMGKDFLKDINISDLKDIRNQIKSYSKGFSKARKNIICINNDQNEFFRNQLRFDIFKTNNLYYNFGSYWTDNKKIIGNTHEIEAGLCVKSMFDSDISYRILSIGNKISTYVLAIKNEFGDNTEEYNIKRPVRKISIKKHIDFNTNKDELLFGKNQCKELNLLYINLLCDMNFVKYVLHCLFEKDNIWVFRIEYLVSYYTYLSLGRLKNYCENNKDVKIDVDQVSDIISEGKKMFCSNLRNCMMHYDLVGANVITKENANKDFFGIIENCFEGMSYQEYLISLHQYSDMIIDYLEKQFDFSNISLGTL